VFGRNGTLNFMSDDVSCWSLESCPVLGPSLFLLLHTTNSRTRASDLPVCIVITLLFLLGELMLWPSRKMQAKAERRAS
jgi:hypothetical protein